MANHTPIPITETYKALTDYAKHLATISAGDILLLATFLEKIVSRPHVRWLIAVSIAALMVTLVTSTLFIAGYIFGFQADTGSPKRLMLGTIAILLLYSGMATFVTSIVVLGTFIICNI